MSSENGQNPNITFSNNIAPKVTKQLVAKNKPSKRSTKTNANKNINKPLKVVYISNPMKFQVNADEFQALVQGLTGRDAVEWTHYNSNNNHYLAQNMSPIDGGIVHQHDEVVDEVQHEPLMDDDQVQVDGYDGPFEMNLDCFEPFNSDFICGDENKGHMIGCYGGFPSFYD